MDQPDYQKTRQRVDEVLKENFVLSPPVRIEDIAANYGLTLVEADLADDIAGFIDQTKKKIYVNKNDSDTRQAFTIAHELGHWLLHRTQLNSDPDKYAVLYRKPLGGSNGDPVEKEANFFAAHLLVPKSLLEKYKDEDPNTIAKIFGVSPEVVGYRMKNEYDTRT